MQHNTREAISPSQLKDLLDYDAETGVFRWKISGRGYPGIGVVAGNTSHVSGYRVISVRGRKYLAHRLAWLYVYGEFPNSELDHIDRDTDNNAVANLRACTRRGNSYNTVRDPGKTSPHCGVSWDKSRRKWAAKIRLPNGTRRQLGRFDEEAEAAAAYAEAKASINPFLPSPTAYPAGWQQIA